MNEKLKKIFEVILAGLVAIPVCIAMIVSAYAIFFAIGIVIIVIIIIIVPIAVVINTITNLFDRKKTNTTITIKKEDFKNDEDEFEMEEDL